MEHDRNARNWGLLFLPARNKIIPVTLIALMILLGLAARTTTGPSLSQASGEVLLYSQDFESGLLAEWNLESGWQIVQVPGGQTWERRTNGIVEGEGLTIRGFAIEPGNSDVVYAVGEISSWVWAGQEMPGRAFDRVKGVVYKTTDAGLHWQAVRIPRFCWPEPATTLIPTEVAST